MRYIGYILVLIHGILLVWSTGGFLEMILLKVPYQKYFILTRKRYTKCLYRRCINVLRVLGLHEDFLKLAADDEVGRKLQDLKLLGGK